MITSRLSAASGIYTRSISLYPHLEAAIAEKLLSLREAAELSGLSASHLRLLARSGRLEARKLGRDWVTTPAAVLAYLADERERANDPRKRTRQD